MKISAIVDDSELQSLFKTLRENSSDMSDYMRDASIYMKKKIMDNFEDEGNPNWKPLSENYLKYKMKVKGASKILEFHGELKQSINSKYGKMEAETFTAKKYGVYQQTGTGRLPARPFMPSDDVPDMQPFDQEGMDFFVRKATEAVMKGV
jgi:phage gpG-like protein